jgi:hypothetical protein
VTGAQTPLVQASLAAQPEIIAPVVQACPASKNGVQTPLAPGARPTQASPS